jgi:tRNA (cmo5U34)-methyltransferase
MSQPFGEFDVSAHFDESLAGKYDRRIRLFCPSYDALHWMLVPWLVGLPERSYFLSAGAGTGAEIVTLGRRFPFWRFVAVDASSEMLAACRERLSGAGLAERLEFFKGLLQQYRAPTPLDDASSVFVAHFIKNRDEKLAYFRSVADSLKPGGLFVLADLFGDKDSPEFARLLDVWFTSYESHGVSAEDLARDRAHVMNDVSFISEDDIHDMLIEAGFSPQIRFYQTYLFGGWVTTNHV